MHAKTVQMTSLNMHAHEAHCNNSIFAESVTNLLIINDACTPFNVKLREVILILIKSNCKFQQRNKESRTKQV